MKKTLWVGIVDSQITFFGTNPQDNVEGLQGLRKFHVEANNNDLKLTDDNGGNVIQNTTSGGGANSSDLSEQTAQQVEQGQAGQQTA